MKRFKAAHNILKTVGGFTLVEAMVATGIVGFLLTTIVTSEKVFDGAKKGASLSRNRQRLTSIIQKTLISRLACEATFNGMDPAAGATVNDLRDAAGGVVISSGQVFGSSGAAGEQTSRGQIEIVSMLLSNYEDTTTLPSVHYNRAGEATFTVTMRLRDATVAGGGRTIAERFKVRVGLTGSTISSCSGDLEFDVSSVCRAFQGLFDGTTSPRLCRSTYVATLGGVDLRGTTDNDSAMELEGTTFVNGNSLVGGVVTVNSNAAFAAGSLRVDNGARLEGDVFVSSSAFGTWGAENFLYFSNGLTIGNLGNSMPSSHSLYVRGDVHAGHVLMENFNVNIDSSAATVGYIRDRLGELLSTVASDKTAILVDMTNALEATSSLAAGMVRYICSGASSSNRVSVRSASGSYLAPSYSSGDCVMQVTYEMTNCQQDEGESQAAAESECSNVYGNNVFINGSSRSNWNYPL